MPKIINEDQARNLFRTALPQFLGGLANGDGRNDMQLPEAYDEPTVEPIDFPKLDLADFDALEVIKEARDATAKRLAPIMTQMQSYGYGGGGGENYEAVAIGGGFNVPGFGRIDPVGMFTNLVGGAAEDVGVASASRVNRVNSSVRQLAQVVENLKNRYMGTERMTRINGAKLSAMEARWRRYFGQEGQMQRAVMQAAQALPGVVSRNVQQSDEYAKFLKGIEGMARTFDRAGDKPADVALEAVPAIEAAASPGVYNGTLIKQGLDSAYENAETLAQRVQELEDIVFSLKADFAEHEVLDSIGTLKEYNAADSLVDLAKLVPSQWHDQTQAYWEMGLKYVLGRKGQGDSLLAGII